MFALSLDTVRAETCEFYKNHKLSILVAIKLQFLLYVIVRFSFFSHCCRLTDL